MPKPNVLFFPHTRYGMQYLIRLLWPARELLDNGFDVRVINPDPDRLKHWSNKEFSDDMTWADVIVIQMPGTVLAVRVIDFAKSAGKKVVVDLDDNPFHLEPLPFA